VANREEDAEEGQEEADVETPIFLIVEATIMPKKGTKKGVDTPFTTAFKPPWAKKGK